MNLYFDTAYVAKCYSHEVDSDAVRKLAGGSTRLYTSSWCIPEMACVFRRQIREFKVPRVQISQAREFFLADIENGVWSLLPVTERFLFRVESLVSALPSSSYIRSGDAIHLTAALDGGFSEIWSNDRRLLEAAPAFGLTGKSV